MRHFRSILYALVLAPAVWVLVGVGLTHDLTARGRDGFAVESFTGLVLLLLGGAAYAILLFAPISPLGPVLTGLVFLTAGVWAIEAPAGYAALWPNGVTKEGFDLSRPGYGLAALLSVPMILTVLSVRRWSGFEPVVLPIIGPLGRARGAAAAPGTPMAVLQTAVLAAPSVRPVDDGELTTVLGWPGAGGRPDVAKPPLDGAVEVTTVLEATTVLEDTPVLEATTVLEDTPVLEEPTHALADERPTEALPGDEPTAEVGDEHLTSDMAEGLPTAATGSAGDEPTAAFPDEQPTSEVADGPPTAATDPADDDPTETITDDEPTEAIADDEPTRGEAVAGEAVADEAVADIATEQEREGPADEVPDDETTVGVLGADGLPAADDDAGEPVAEGDAAAASHPTAVPADDGERTQLIRPVPVDGQRTQIIRPVGYDPGASGRTVEPPGDRTRVIRPAGRGPDDRAWAADSPAEETQTISRNGATTSGRDETQVIRWADDGERTQVIRPGLVTPPGERTQFLGTGPIAQSDDGRLSGSARRAGDDAAVPSIAGAESPNFADDPTGLIIPVTPRDDEPARTMTVMNIERPPDAVPGIPAQRKPTRAED